MDALPLFVRLRDRPVLVIGGGEVAARKLELLRRAGARITCIALDFDEAVAADPAIERIRRGAEPADVDGFRLVVCATSDAALNRAVAAEAERRGIWVNVVDDPPACTVTVPSIVDRSPLVVALASGGRAPVLLRSLRTRLEALLPQRLGRLTEWFGARRDRIKAAVPDPVARRRFWEGLIEGPVAEHVLAGREADGERAFTDALAEARSGGAVATGEVYLVGAGPGDPDLLTLRALRLMQQADVVLHDRLVSEAVLERVRRDAERLYVGKRRSDHAVPQPELTAKLIELARQGKRVLRLKGGDPFVFGRGGEELEGLIRERLPFQVVPGISAANGCAAYAGIPLTHRDHAQSVRFVTGHLKDGEPNLDWPELARPGQTLVVYMGLLALGQIATRLVAHGMDPHTPIAVVENGTLPLQRVLVATLADVTARVEREGVTGPSLLIVGDVVRLRERLAWERQEATVGASRELFAAPSGGDPG